MKSGALPTHWLFWIVQWGAASRRTLESSGAAKRRPLQPVVWGVSLRSGYSRKLVSLDLAPIGQAVFPFIVGETDGRAPGER
jgi:hypothetical protein